LFVYSTTALRPPDKRIVVVEIFVHGAVKATVTNVPQSQLVKSTPYTAYTQHSCSRGTWWKCVKQQFTACCRG